MAIYDISLPISESLVVWPGDPPIRITQPRHLDRGDSATVSRLDIGAHTGTHVDAPAHFIPGGAGVDSLDLNVLVGPALVVHALEADALSADVLDGLQIPPATARPDSTKPTEMHHSGMPCTNSLVPSSGSTIQTLSRPRRPGSSAVSSDSHPSPA